MKAQIEHMDKEQKVFQFYFIVSESINRLSFSEKLTLYQQRHSDDLKLTIQNLLPTYYGN